MADAPRRGVRRSDVYAARVAEAVAKQKGQKAPGWVTRLAQTSTRRAVVKPRASIESESTGGSELPIREPGASLRHEEPTPYTAGEVRVVLEDIRGTRQVWQLPSLDAVRWPADRPDPAYEVIELDTVVTGHITLAPILAVLKSEHEKREEDHPAP